MQFFEIKAETKFVPNWVFYSCMRYGRFNKLKFVDAVRGKTLIEMGLSLNPNLLRMDMTLETGQMQFLGSKDHAGFIYIRRTYQCMQNLLVPKETYLIGILIHKWEIPWAKILPLRLILRLGALHQFYPTSVLSVRCRDSVYAEIGHTIIKILAVSFCWVCS